MIDNNIRRAPRWMFGVAMTIALMVGVAATVSAQSPDWSSFAAPNMDDMRVREPEEMRQSLNVLVAQTQLLSTIVGLPQDTTNRLGDIRGAVNALTPEGLARVAHEAGPHINQLNRILMAVNQSSVTDGRITQRSSGFPDAVYPFEPTPSVDFSDNPPDTTGCDPEADDYVDCISDLFGVSRPDNLGASACQVSQRKDAGTLFGLKFGVTVAETVAVILNRICEFDILGTNGSLACLPSDLVFLALRTAEDFIHLCEDLLTAAEALGNYERIGHIHGDLETAQSTIDGVASDLATHDTHLASHDSNLISHDAKLTLHDMNLGEHDAHLETHDDDVKALMSTLQGGLVRNQRLLFDALRLMITPEGKRKVDGALLTCQGDDCPMVLPCAKGGLDFPCK